MPVAKTFHMSKAVSPFAPCRQLSIAFDEAHQSRSMRKEYAIEASLQLRTTRPPNSERSLPLTQLPRAIERSVRRGRYNVVNDRRVTRAMLRFGGGAERYTWAASTATCERR